MPSDDVVSLSSVDDVFARATVEVVVTAASEAEAMISKVDFEPGEPAVGGLLLAAADPSGGWR